MANASKLRIKELQAALGRMGVRRAACSKGGASADALAGALRDGKRPDAAAAGDDVFDDDVVELKTSKMPKAGGGPQQPPAAGCSPFGGGAPGGSCSAAARPAARPLRGRREPVRRIRRGRRHAEHRRSVSGMGGGSIARNGTGAWAMRRRAAWAANNLDRRRPWATPRSWPPSRRPRNRLEGHGRGPGLLERTGRDKPSERERPRGQGDPLSLTGHAVYLPRPRIESLARTRRSPWPV